MTSFRTLSSYAVLLFSLYPCTIFNMEKIPQPQPHSIIYAPWRENYVNKITHEPTQQLTNKSCVFCRMISNRNNTLDKERIIHWGDHSLIMLASQPYIENGIHFLIVPYEHIREISDLSTKTYKEENVLTQKLCALFGQDHNEIYINTNQGRSAGASIPTHHHKHIIINKAPRYYNLIQAIQETKTTINVEALCKRLQERAAMLPTITVPQKSYNPLCNKDCYHCSIIQQCNRDNCSMSKNLIIHRGENVSMMLSHYPTYLGEIDIMPNDHIESLETMPLETYEEMNNLAVAMYPLLLRMLNTTDSNIGMISYGAHAQHKEHIKHKIIPRHKSWNTTPITEAHHISANIKKFYLKLLSAWHALLLNNNMSQQPSKL